MSNLPKSLLEGPVGRRAVGEPCLRCDLARSTTGRDGLTCTCRVMCVEMGRGAFHIWQVGRTRCVAYPACAPSIFGSSPHTRMCSTVPPPMMNSIACCVSPNATNAVHTEKLATQIRPTFFPFTIWHLYTAPRSTMSFLAKQFGTFIRPRSGRRDF